jgi:hypothetical protein
MAKTQQARDNLPPMITIYLTLQEAEAIRATNCTALARVRLRLKQLTVNSQLSIVKGD